MKLRKWSGIVTAGGFAFLLTFGAAVLIELNDRAAEAAELSCLASLGTALQMMPVEELPALPDVEDQWRALTESERIRLLEAAARTRVLDCPSHRREGLFAHRYGEPEIAVRRMDGGLEFQLRVQASPRFYEIGGGRKVLLREVKIWL